VPLSPMSNVFVIFSVEQFNFIIILAGPISGQRTMGQN